RRWLGRALRAQGRLVEARAAYRQALKRAPRDAAVLNDLGNAYVAEGNHDQAVRQFELAAKADPRLAEPHYNRAHALRQAGREDEAKAALGRYLELAPEDPAGARLVLASLGAAPPPPEAGAAYVRALFDESALRFERLLVEELGYRGPELIHELAAPLTGERLAMLDLGCGTGLAALPWKPRARRLVGVDLSPAMLAAARARRIYDSLHEAEIGAFLAATEERFDLMLAADLLIYIGAIEPLFVAAAARLNPRGLFAATAEAAAEPDAVTVGRGLRYAHGQATIARAAAASGLSVAAWRTAPGRSESGRPVPFHVFVLRKE
ncbi:MAG: tetratricopeptide repeat protein, partial [Alphaproteobacteria bacterium]|nr:tetratricopeptide repeat protein [Alphaproteobacteria bacterium]